MKRLRRSLFHALVLVSLILCAAASVIWWRSGRAKEFFIATRSGVIWKFETDRYGLYVMRATGWPGPFLIWRSGFDSRGILKDHTEPLLFWGHGGGASPKYHDFLGVSGTRGGARTVLDPSGAAWLGPPFPPGDSTTWMFSQPMPCWSFFALHGYVVTVLALPTLLMLAMTARRRIVQNIRRRSSGCPVCGYDLRATPDRCPECGTIPWK